MTPHSDHLPGPGPTPRFVETCLLHYEASTIRKWVVFILLECFLVLSVVLMVIQIKSYNISACLRAFQMEICDILLSLFVCLICLNVSLSMCLPVFLSVCLAFYRPPPKLSEANAFSRMCLSGTVPALQRTLATAPLLYRILAPPYMFKLVDCRKAGNWHSTEIPSCRFGLSFSMCFPHCVSHFLTTFSSFHLHLHYVEKPLKTKCEVQTGWKSTKQKLKVNGIKYWLPVNGRINYEW